MLRFLTSGESHGKGLNAILEGMPAGLKISESDIKFHLSRRQEGYGRGGRMKIEKDYAEIISGVRHGITLGSPIGLFIKNLDHKNWLTQMNIEKIDEEIERVTKLRPGHADFAGTMKYDFDDVRNVLERSSARETTARVAVGSIARKLLEEFKIKLHSHVVSIGGIEAKQTNDQINWEEVANSPVKCADPEISKAMMKKIDEAKKRGDTVGGIVEIIVTQVPVGLGSYVHWDRKVDARIAKAIMSINAVKAVSIGDGWESVNQFGSDVHDVISPITPNSEKKFWDRKTNKSGGTEGGMTTGMPLKIKFAIKPISTLAKPLPSVDLDTGELVEAHYERSDVCQVPPAGVIGESMVAFVLADLFLEKFGSDNINHIKTNYTEYLKTIKPRNFR